MVAAAKDLQRGDWAKAGMAWRWESCGSWACQEAVNL